MRHTYTTAALEPDRNQIEIFVDALLRYRGAERFLSLRAFYRDDKPLASEHWSLSLKESNFKHLADRAVEMAARAAKCGGLFCPPLAVFSDPKHAREIDLLAGLAITVECDQHPEEARQKLQEVLGEATAIVRSGGQWINPEDGEGEDKLHLHWRLKTPATGDALVELKRARRLATALVGGDRSNVPIEHCIRWPGSWHCKAEPRLCEIVACNPDREIDLAEALAALKAVVPELERDRADGTAPSGDDYPKLYSNIIAGRDLHQSIVQLAAKYVGSLGSDAKELVFAARQIEALMLNSAARVERPTDWQSRYNDIGRAVDTAAKKYGKPPESDKPLFIDMSGWTAENEPPREWAVQDRIPARQPTLFSGEGAVGKSMTELHLCAAHVLGRDWLGMLPEPGAAIYLGAEDEPGELHRRLAAIARHYGVEFRDLIAGGLHLLSLAGEDALLGVPDREGKIVATPLYNRLLQAAGDIKPQHIGIDTASDVYGGNENDRAQVRQFVGLLRKLAFAGNCAVVLLSHPSLTGINSGSGLSGSTGWHNSVRARIYMHGRKTGEGEQPDDDLREIEFKKNQYGPKGPSIALRYRNGLFLPELGMSSIERAAFEQRVDETFVRVLRKLIEQGRPPAPSPQANRYAPTVIAKHPDGKVYSKKDYIDAMERLLDRKEIRIETYGRAAQPCQRLVLT